MGTDRLIRYLRALEKEHKNDPVCTFETVWHMVCHDAAERLEEQEKELEMYRNKFGAINIEVKT